MLGSHLSIAGGLTTALDEAVPLRLDTVQIFTKNQQQWKVKPLADADISAWRSRLDAMNWPRLPEGPHAVVSHASYLINLASVSDELWRQSVDLMTVEIERCEALDVGLLVHHPGSFKDSTLEAGLKRIADAYAELFGRTRGFRTISCLEGTVGAGSQIGGRLEHLARLREMIIDRTGAAGRVGFCLDTCHLHAAGYGLHGAAAARGVLEQVRHVLGVEKVRVLHVNDSKGAAGSKLDRHEHLGKGTIGEEGLVTFACDKAFRGIPKILETPKGLSPDGVDFDQINLRLLRRGLGLDPGPEPAATKPAKAARGRGTLVRTKARAGKAGAKVKGAAAPASRSSRTTRQPRKPRAK